jgi:hypothetical protein
MGSIMLRASEHWSKVIKQRKVRDPRLRGIVRKQTTLLHSEMTLANPASKQAELRWPPTIRSTHRSNRSPGNFAADATILDVLSPNRKLPDYFSVARDPGTIAKATRRTTSTVSRLHSQVPGVS